MHEKNRKVRRMNGKPDKDTERYKKRHAWDDGLGEKMSLRKDRNYIEQRPHRYLLGSSTLDFLAKFVSLESVTETVTTAALLNQNEEIMFNMALSLGDESGEEVMVEITLLNYSLWMGKRVKITSELLTQLASRVYEYQRFKDTTLLYVELGGSYYEIKMKVIADISILDTDEVLIINRGVYDLYLEGNSEGFRYNIIGGMIQEFDFIGVAHTTTHMGVGAIKEKTIQCISPNILFILELVGDSGYHSCGFNNCKIHLYGNYNRVSGRLYSLNGNKLFPLEANSVNHAN